MVRVRPEKMSSCESGPEGFDVAVIPLEMNVEDGSRWKGKTERRNGERAWSLFLTGHCWGCLHPTRNKLLGAPIEKQVNGLDEK